MPRFGFAVGVVSLITAIASLGLIFWFGGWSLITLGPMAFCGALVAFSHGSWRLASVTCIPALCVSILAVTRTATLQYWQIALLLATVIAVLVPGYWLWMNYRKTRDPGARSHLPQWVLAAQREMGVFVGTISLAIGFLTWLGADFAYCRAYNLHLLEEQISLKGDACLLAPLAFLGGLTSIGCGAWRLGTVATYISLGALVVVAHTLGMPSGAAFVSLTFPLFLFFLPFLLPPFHPLYNPWLGAALSAFLIVGWLAGRRRKPTH